MIAITAKTAGTAAAASVLAALVFRYHRYYRITATIANITAIATIASCAGYRVNGESPELKTFGTSGKQQHVLQKGVEAELFRYEGRGALTHMWFGGGFQTLGQTRLRIYVDGEATASIDMQLYLGHGIGFNDPGAPWGTERIGILGNQGGLYNTYRVPFGRSIRITAMLSAEETAERPPFWWIIRGTENLTVEIAGVRLPDNARLKLHTREAYTGQPLEEFDLINTPNRGVLYLVTMAATSTNLSYMEAVVRAYIDGAAEPLWVSSGLEDYFLGTYYFQTGRYHTPIAGLTHFNPDQSSFTAYRFHEEDPIFFARGLRLTARVGEELNGKMLFDPQPTTFWTHVFTYEW
jgi:hypothetical protein